MIVALVPTNVATVTLALAACAVCLRVCLEEAAHATVVPDVQDAVLHKWSSDTVALGVKLYEPKLSPVIVTVPEPDPAVLLGTLLLYTGAAHQDPHISLEKSMLSTLWVPASHPLPSCLHQR